MHLLLEPNDQRMTPLGVVTSLIAHAVLVGAVVLAYRGGASERDRLLDEFATFLVPLNREANFIGVDNSSFERGTDGASKKSNQRGQGGRGTEGGTGFLSTTTGDTATQVSISLPSILGDSVLTEIEVDSAVKRYEWSAAPDYPLDLLKQNIEGAAFVIYVVDTLGIADTASFTVVRTTHDQFADAVKNAMPKMRFRPAILSGMKVRQLVQQNFTFKIQRPDTVLPPIVKAPPPAE